MVLGGGHGVKAALFGQLRNLAQFREHFLIFVVIATNGPQPFALLKRRRDGRQDKKIEFHGTAS